MTKKIGRVGAVAGMVRLFAALAIVALPLWGCSDAGDSPLGPGEGGQNGDTGESSITATVGNGIPGGVVAISGQYLDGNRKPVQGVGILASAEGWGHYFSFTTNPTYTDADGRFSIDVNINSDTPPSSYTLIVRTSPGWSGPMTVAYLHMKVTGSRSVTDITLTGPSSISVGSIGTFTATVNGVEDECLLVIDYKTSGVMTLPWMELPQGQSTRDFSIVVPAGTPTGNLTVTTRAHCVGSTEMVESTPLSVSVIP